MRFLSAQESIGNGVEKACVADALALVVNDDGWQNIVAEPVMPKLDLLAAKIGRRFVAMAVEAEGVVFLDGPFGLGIKEFVMMFRWREEADAWQVDAKAVDRPHADGVVRHGVVLSFDPVGELAVERIERREVEAEDKELIADTAEEAFDLPLGRGIADRGVAEEASDPGRDEGDFAGAVDRTVVDQQLLRHAAFVKGTAEGLNEGVGILLEEELAVAKDTARIVEEGDELGLLTGTGPTCAAVRAEHGIGLPELIGVLHAEGKAFLAGVGVGFGKQVIFADESVEGGLGDAFRLEQAFFDAEAVDGALVGFDIAEVSEVAPKNWTSS